MLHAAAMRIYLDYNATTPVDRAVLEAMLPYFAENFGNASSIHSSGQRGRSAVDAARDSVAALIGAKAAEVVFTSGGTEADNLALFGSVMASNQARKHVITTAIEHHAVLNAAQALEKQGIDVTYVSVSGDGVVDPQDIRRELRPETILISVMHANNELGTIQPIEEIGRIAAEADVYFHCDAVQSAGKMPLDVNRLGVDLLSVSASRTRPPAWHRECPGHRRFRKGSRIGENELRDGCRARSGFSRPSGRNVDWFVEIGACEWRQRSPRCEYYKYGFCWSRGRGARDRSRSPRYLVFHGSGLFVGSRRAVARVARHRVTGGRSAVELAIQPGARHNIRRDRSRDCNYSADGGAIAGAIAAHIGRGASPVDFHDELIDTTRRFLRR
jgi:hypothetical protein